MNIFEIFEEKDNPYSRSGVLNEDNTRDSFILFLNHYKYFYISGDDDFLESSIEQIFLSKIKNYADIDASKLKRITSLSQTVFEKELLLALIINFIYKNMIVAIQTRYGWDWITLKTATPYDIVIKIKPQYRFEGKFADIFIEMDTASVWIECDGRQAHSGSRQFVKDRKRDRELRANFNVMHFANAEIVSSTYKVVNEITNVLISNGYFWRK